MRALRLAVLASAALLAACASIPPKPELPPSLPASVKSLKLRLAAENEESGGLASTYLMPAFENVLSDAGMPPVADAALADATLSLRIESGAMAYNPYTTHLLVRDAGGRQVDRFDFTGGVLGGSYNDSPEFWKTLADSIATNLLAEFFASPKVAAFAAEREKTRALAAAGGGKVDASALKALVAESIKEASGKSGDASGDEAMVSDVDAPKFKLPENPNDYALVVGVEKYSGELPEARFAERDAAAVKRSLLALGFPERNIKLLSGSRAGRAALEAYLEDWLPKNAKADGTVVFYFSGHGSPNPVTGEAYLVPWDGDPAYLDKTGFPLKRLYADLNALKARRVLVALDSCFSGAGARSVLPRGARPLVSKVSLGDSAGAGKLVILTASGGNQISGTLDAQGHGLFTYYLLRGLNGPAAAADGSVTAKGLYEYLSPRVEDEASRANRGQSPQLVIGADASDLRLR